MKKIVPKFKKKAIFQSLSLLSMCIFIFASAGRAEEQTKQSAVHALRMAPTNPAFIKYLKTPRAKTQCSTMSGDHSFGLIPP